MLARSMYFLSFTNIHNDSKVGKCIYVMGYIGWSWTNNYDCIRCNMAMRSDEYIVG